MRRVQGRCCRRWPFRLWIKVLLVLGVGLALLANGYINTEIRPTLMQLAEYEARYRTTQAIHSAVQRTLQENSQACVGLYAVEQDCVQLDTAKINTVRNLLLQAVQQEMSTLPLQTYEIPFGSLTGNSLLSGHGPGWQVELQPQGYVQAEWKESSESLSINVTRYSAWLEIGVILNMVLDGRTETLTVTDQIPLASILLRGDTPSTYAAVSD